jgi:uncharacterized protein (UPF0218 family)
MTIEYTLTSKLRAKLKEPFGNLIEGVPNETICRIKKQIEKEKPSKIISVGDIVSRNLHKHNINPQLTIIDNLSQREKLLPQEAFVEKTIYVNNPRGTITKEANCAVKQALEKNEHTHIIVEGEEDLLTLVAVLYAPKNAFVIYGQPYSGIVVVKVTSKKKALVQEVLNNMKTSKS